MEITGPCLCCDGAGCPLCRRWLRISCYCSLPSAVVMRPINHCIGSPIATESTTLFFYPFSLSFSTLTDSLPRRTTSGSEISRKYPYLPYCINGILPTFVAILDKQYQASKDHDPSVQMRWTLVLPNRLFHEFQVCV